MRFYLGRRFGNTYGGVSVGRYGRRRNNRRPRVVQRVVVVKPTATPIPTQQRTSPTGAIVAGFIVIALVVSFWYIILPIIAVLGLVFLAFGLSRNKPGTSRPPSGSPSHAGSGGPDGSVRGSSRQRAWMADRKGAVVGGVWDISDLKLALQRALAREDVLLSRIIEAQEWITEHCRTPGRDSGFLCLECDLPFPQHTTDCLVPQILAEDQT